MVEVEPKPKPLPPPWDRLFSLGSRIFVWGLIGGIIYILRPFFLLVFLTFVFAYVQAHGVDGVAHRIAKRWVRVVLVFLVFLGTLVAVGIFLAPNIQDQVTTIAEKYPTWVNDANTQLLEFAKDNNFEKRLPPDFYLGDVVEDLLGLGDKDTGAETVSNTIEFMGSAASWLLTVGSAFLLSLLFSFLIVLDLPKLTRGVQGLAKTRVGFIYSEVAGNLYNFCKVLGRAMEAQLFIAMCNTILTAVGLWIIGLGAGSMVFLCTVVFLCSFIPVAGVFFSSTPICIVALSEHGFSMLLAAIVMILIIHFIEAYFLNPKIYGQHLRMNPVLTLIILTVCGKLFGPWGLVLGIPVLNYLFSHAIRFRQPTSLDEQPPSAQSA